MTNKDKAALVTSAHDAARTLYSDHRFQSILALVTANREAVRDRLEITTDAVEFHQLQGEAKNMKWLMELPKRALMNKDKRTQ